MDIFSQIAAWGGWAWIVAGLVLLALELVAPGGVFVWLGVSGILTGLTALFQPIAWPFQWLIFGAVSLVTIFGWLSYARTKPAPPEENRINRGGERFLGHEGVLQEPIAGGFGRLPLGDSVWRVTGPDLPAGQRVRVVGSEGPLLRVEPVGQELPDDQGARSNGTGGFS